MKTEQKLEWLINYLNLKNELLAKASDGKAPTLTEDGDLIELMLWPAEYIDTAYDSIIKTLKDWSNVIDRELCPWCIIFDSDCSDCSDCGWGARHGICSSALSGTYRKVGETLSSSITDTLKASRVQILELEPKPAPKPKKKCL